MIMCVSFVNGKVNFQGMLHIFFIFLPTKQSQDSLWLKTEILKKYVVLNSIYKSRPKQVLNLPNNSGNKYFCICFWSPFEWSDMFDLGLVPLEQMHFLFLLSLSCFCKNTGSLSEGPSDPSINLSTLLGSIMSHVNKICGKIWNYEKRQILPWIVIVYSFIRLSDPTIQQIHIQYSTIGLLWRRQAGFLFFLTFHSSGKEEWNRQLLASLIPLWGKFLKPIAVPDTCNSLIRNEECNWVFAKGLIKGVSVQNKGSFTIWSVLLLLEAERVVAISWGEE